MSLSMESSNRLLKARKNLQVADHMIHITYPFLQEPRLLLSILDNIFLIYANGMTALLEYEKEQKQRESVPDDFQTRFDIFRLECIEKYRIDNHTPQTIQDLKEMVLCHKRSPVEFRRKDEFIICSDQYDLKKLSIRQMKSYVTKAKLFIERLSNIIE